MSIKPPISVIMSVYNSERYLDISIESILSQTFKEFEFIIINDGSNDNSLKIIKKYQKKDTRIKIINNNKNIGLTKSLNKGLRIAKGKYIARMDADDISATNRLKKEYHFLEFHQNYFLCASYRYLIDENNSRLYDYSVNLDDYNLPKLMLKSNFLAHSSIMFRKGIIYREKFVYAQDYDLYLRIISDNKKIHIIQEYLTRYRICSDAISIIKQKQQRLFAKKALEFFQERKENGKDLYNFWNNNKILNESDSNAEIIFLQNCIENGLKKKNRKKISLYLTKYKSLKKYSKFRYLIYLFFYKVPISYRIYRKIFYGDNLE